MLTYYIMETGNDYLNFRSKPDRSRIMPVIYGSYIIILSLPFPFHYCFSFIYAERMLYNANVVNLAITGYLHKNESVQSRTRVRQAATMSCSIASETRVSRVVPDTVQRCILFFLAWGKSENGHWLANYRWCRSFPLEQMAQCFYAIDGSRPICERVKRSVAVLRDFPLYFCKNGFCWKKQPRQLYKRLQ